MPECYLFVDWLNPAAGDKKPSKTADFASLHAFVFKARRMLRPSCSAEFRVCRALPRSTRDCAMMRRVLTTRSLAAITLATAFGARTFLCSSSRDSRVCGSRGFTALLAGWRLLTLAAKLTIRFYAAGALTDGRNRISARGRDRLNSRSGLLLVFERPSTHGPSAS